jgi:hypothetical protein
MPALTHRYRVNILLRRSLPFAFALACAALFLSGSPAEAQALRDYEGLTPGQIIETESQLLTTYARTLAPDAADRATALEAISWVLAERRAIQVSLRRFFPIDGLEGMQICDAVDDSLARAIHLVARTYARAHPPSPPADTTGALALFRGQIAASPGVGDVPVPFSTIAAVKYGLDALADSRQTGHNAVAAEIAFLHYVDDITGRFIGARRTLRQRHAAEMRNEDWVLARLRCSDCGAQDWDPGALFMKIKQGTSDYYHTRELTCRKCGRVMTWDYFLPSFSIMNRIGAASLPGESDSTETGAAPSGR